MDPSNNPFLVTTTFESGIKSKDYRFQWHIKDLQRAFKTGLIEPCTSLISEISMEFTTADQIGYPASWRFSLDYDKRTEQLMLKAMPRKLFFGSADYIPVPQTGTPTIYVVVEVENCGEFTLLNEKTQTSIINVRELEHYSATVCNLSPSLPSSPSLSPQVQSTTFASPTIPQFGRGFPSASPPRMRMLSLPPPKSAPILLPLIHCNDAFLTTLQSNKGCLTLTIKVTLLQSYRHGTGTYVSSEQSKHQHDKQGEDSSSETKTMNTNVKGTEDGSSASNPDASGSGEKVKISKSQDNLNGNPVEVSVVQNEEEPKAKRRRLQNKQDAGAGDKINGGSNGNGNSGGKDSAEKTIPSAAKAPSEQLPQCSRALVTSERNKQPTEESVKVVDRKKADGEVKSQTDPTQ